MIRKILHKPLLSLMKTTRDFELSVSGYENISNLNSTAIFAVNHTNSHDIPVASEVIKSHHFVLLGKQPLKLVDRIAFWINGVIYVDRKDKTSKVNAKVSMIETLKRGTNILMFPEGSWNTSPNKIMQPLYWGIIDIAKTADVPIIPIILEYTKDICYASIGKPILFKSENKTENIIALRDTMATLRYDIWDSLEHKKRSEIEDDYFERVLNEAIKEYPILDMAYEQSVIRKEYETYQQAFEHLNYIHPNINNAFLFNNRSYH